MKPIISASLLSANFACLGEDANFILQSGADWLHVDVMDNHYVPNLTFGPMICQSLRHYGIQAELDVHLMVTPVDALIEPFAKAGANCITFHPEATLHPHRTARLIQSFGLKVGIALNPASPLSLLDELYGEIDRVLVMSVNPGFGGQHFIESSVDKIARLHAILQKQHHKRHIQIAVDGGINQETAKQVVQAGAEILVIGSSLFQAQNKAEWLLTLKQQC